MNNMTKRVVALTFPLLIFASAAKAEQFAGYAVQVLSGASGTNANFDAALVGLSTTPTGPVSLYRFTSDHTYATMLSNMRIHQQKARVAYVGGTITGIYLDNP